MSKTIKNCFIQKLTFDNLLQAYIRARKNKSNKLEVKRFYVDLETNISNLLNDIKNNKYKLGKYREFKIYEPKERVIKCLPFKDRIVQQWYIHEFIKPYIMPRLIYTTCACIDNRGTHKAVYLVDKYMKNIKAKYPDYYILKLDIKKYFYNIDKDILYNIMSNYISDKLLLNMTRLFIYDNNSKTGIPIGNYTSQYFANIYLSVLDRYIKEELKIKYYVRYMDDMVLLLKDKLTCIQVLDKIKLFLSNKLKLTLNPKSRYYPNKMGINFCGYRIYDNYILIRNNCKYKIKHKIKKWKTNKEDNIILSYNSFISHIKHANTYRLYIKINSLYSDISIIN